MIKAFLIYHFTNLSLALASTHIMLDHKHIRYNASQMNLNIIETILHAICFNNITYLIQDMIS